MDKEIYIGVDIGGTHISCAPVDIRTGKIVGDVETARVDSKGSSTGILRSWQSALHSVIEKNKPIMGIGFAIPGPFDYEKGISLIEGVQKYDSLFGLNIKESIFSDRNDYVSMPMAFINDASGFALGEYYAGAAKGSKRSLISTLGTGFGSTFLIDGRIQQEETTDVPPNGYLYNIPFKENIADDYFSTRWFVNTWLQKTGEEVEGVKEIAQYALQNNPQALAVFAEFSNNLVEFITPWLQKFKPDTWVIGGSIAKASVLFLEQVISALKEKNIENVKIKIGALWDDAPLVGAAMNAQSVLEMTKNEKNQIRKTGQFLAPEKIKSTSQGHYDIYPGFPLGSGKIQEGDEALAKWIAQHKTVVIDGYVGVFWDLLVEKLNIGLSQMGKKVHWYHVDSAMKSPEAINRMVEPFLGEKDSIFGKITDKKLEDWFEKDKLQKIQPDPEADINILVGCGAALAGWKAPLIYVDLPKNELQFRMRAGHALNLGADKQEDFREMYKRFYFVDWRVLNDHKAEVLPQIDLIVDEQRPENYLLMSGEELRKGLTAMSRNYFRVRPWFEPGAWGGSWMKKHFDGLNKEESNLAWSFELMVLENGLMFESDDYRLEVSFDFLMYNNYKEVLGDCAERFKYDFPIRFDFLDTFDGGNLSVQCHPRTDYIQKEFGMPFTQDETYYILNCQNKPIVYLGFQEGIDPEEFHQELLESERTAKPIDIGKYVQSFPAKKHDFFLIPNGTIHASGKDNLVLEISSAPYIFTFKMYDWVRLDLDGRPRPINIEHGMKNVDFSRQGKRVGEEFISKPYIMEETPDYILEHLPTHPMHFYDTHRYAFDKEIHQETNNKCHVWMLVEGSSVVLETADGMKQRFNYAETFVVPANAGSYKIINESNEKALMVKAFVK
ncbi:ROK family protein [Bacteroidales bacterium OttesenSCG-928-A17]|nr:ROK family protein [Bacteroidales bacterium OttesenSCG-928-A17]